jgi:hypothetical protein
VWVRRGKGGSGSGRGGGGGSEGGSGAMVAVVWRCLLVIPWAVGGRRRGRGSVADPCWGDDGDAAWLRRNLLLSMLLLLFLPLFIVVLLRQHTFVSFVEHLHCPGGFSTDFRMSQSELYELAKTGPSRFPGAVHLRRNVVGEA